MLKPRPFKPRPERLEPNLVAQETESDVAKETESEVAEADFGEPLDLEKELGLTPDSEEPAPPERL